MGDWQERQWARRRELRALTDEQLVARGQECLRIGRAARERCLGLRHASEVLDEVRGLLARAINEAFHEWSERQDEGRSILAEQAERAAAPRAGWDDLSGCEVNGREG